MTDEEKAYVISLVRAHLITESEYKSWVPPYTKVRWASVSSRCVAERVGGHWRLSIVHVRVHHAARVRAEDLESASPGLGKRNPVIRVAAEMIALPRGVQLAFACLGIFFSFSYFAVLQEDVYKKPYGGEYFKYTFLALAAERGVNVLIGLLGVYALGSSGLTIPHHAIFVSGISQMLAMAGSNEALRYVSYPTQVLGKSCKMVPVMAGGIVLGGKSYSLFEYLQVGLVTVGVSVFNLVGKKKKKGGADSALGLALIGCSLLMDAVTGGLQVRNHYA